MIPSSAETIKIISLLSEKDTTRFEQMFRAGVFHIRRVSVSNRNWPDIVAQEPFWGEMCDADTDIVLLPVDERVLSRIEREMKPDSMKAPRNPGLWSWLSSAVVAVLMDNSIQTAIRAAQCDFDGILSEPYDVDILSRQLTKAMQRSQDRFSLNRRYQRMHHIFRRVNKDRRLLREKVDLLCQDLVQSNSNLTSILQEMRHAHDFLGEISGEFDQRYMLHKALHIIRQRFADASALIFLCDTNDVEAHVSGAWYDQEHDLEELEAGFKTSIIAETIIEAKQLWITDTDEEPHISTKERAIIGGLTLVTFPIMLEREMLGVLAIYRDSRRPFARSDIEASMTYLLPLARTLENLRRLKSILR